MVTKKEYQRRVAELLMTEDKDEQLQTIEFLTNQAQSPVIDLVVRFDARFGAVNVTTVGSGQGQIDAEQAMDILEAGKKFIAKIEKDAIRQAQQAEAEEEFDPQMDIDMGDNEFDPLEEEVE